MMTKVLLLILLLLLCSRLSAAEAAEPPAKPIKVDRSYLKGKNRPVRVATLCQARLTKDFFEETLVRLDKAAASQPDIVCLPEVFSRRGAETVPGPTTRRLSEWARLHDCYVICSMKTRIGKTKYNSAVVIDRKGKIIGRFDKIHPTEGELKGSTVPGDPNPPVFQTDFGKIGIQICFDVNWRDAWASMVERGAEIIFWPSAYPADRQLSALAWMNKVYVVSSTMTQFAKIYDITGDTIAQTGQYQQWTSATISLDKKLFEIDYHITKMRKLQAKYVQGQRVNVQWIPSSDWLTIESLDPSLSVDDLMAEYKLTPLGPYHARCEKAQAAARKKFEASGGKKNTKKK